jgi:hypothetical protein
MSHSDLETRLQSLERRMQRYRLATTVLGVGLVGLLCVAAESPKATSDEIRTKKLVVVDDQGKDVAHLSSSKNGGIVRVQNRAGYTVFIAGAAETGGRLMVADDEGNEWVKVNVEKAGGQVSISDKKGQKHVLTATPPKPAEK